MQFVDEFRDPELAKVCCSDYKNNGKQPHFTPENPLYLMEVCGGHTLYHFKFGLDRLLPKVSNLFTVQGCPVCVLTDGGELMSVLRLPVAQKSFSVLSVMRCEYADV